MKHFSAVFINYETLELAFQGGPISDVVNPTTGLASWIIAVIVAGVVIFIIGIVAVYLITKRKKLEKDLNLYDKLE